MSNSSAEAVAHQTVVQGSAADQAVSETADSGPTEPPKPPFEPREGVPPLTDSVAALQRYAHRVAAGSGPIALDAERASGYRYSQRAYLVQARRQGAGTALIDPIPIGDLTALQDATAGVEWILHAASQDLACLAELGLRPASLFDTELAGRLLGRERVSLAALVASELGEVLEKGHGAADWSLRPLSAAQLKYAALDVELLIELRDSMDASLQEAGKREIAQQEFDALLSFAPRERGDDEWRRTSGVHKVRKPRDLAVVRALWLTRDEIAQQRDIAVGRIIPDSSIVAAALSTVTDPQALIKLKDFHGRGAERYLSRWWRAIQQARALPNDELPTAANPPSGPPQPRVWAERNPQAWARLEACRSAMNEIADDLTMPVENVLSPDTVRRLAWEPPSAVTEESVGTALAAVGARQWQIERCAGRLARALTEAEE